MNDKHSYIINEHLLEIKDSIDSLRERPIILNSLETFYSDALQLYSDHPLGIRATKKKIIGTMCINIPEELIYACDAIPVRLCNGSHSFDHAGSSYLPTKSCPMVKSLAGAASIYDSLQLKPDLIINPTTCDQKKKIAETPIFQDQEFFTLDVPPSKESEAAQEYWLRSIISLKKKLEKVTGNKITKKRLKDSIQSVLKAQSLFRKLQELRKKSNLIWGTDVIFISNLYFMQDVNTWTKNIELLIKEMEENMIQEKEVCSKKTPRILITGSPSIFPNLKLPQLIEESGAIIAVDEFCSSNRLLYDMAVVDEWNMYDMIPALSDKYLKPNTCPNFTPNTDRIRKMRQSIADYKIDGIVYQTLTGCQLFDMEALIIGQEMKKENIPTLFIETDYSPDDFGQISTRVEAFIDTLKMKKR